MSETPSCELKGEGVPLTTKQSRNDHGAPQRV